ncbi:hypothetical protein DFP72DRAFT_1045340 [Ephemerocybe angulata]|uniref:Uncharacterized protein n=1 Tax=Ephemerocybe angulata TaxID=980116 RepID=A0A8H6HZA8_9AGAR|nr:hypothetical protein DFP72DRAFT_1045340 [Tulosesus angulatus]
MSTSLSNLELEQTISLLEALLQEKRAERGREKWNETDENLLNDAQKLLRGLQQAKAGELPSYLFSNLDSEHLEAMGINFKGVLYIEKNRSEDLATPGSEFWTVENVVRQLNLLRATVPLINASEAEARSIISPFLFRIVELSEGRAVLSLEQAVPSVDVSELRKSNSLRLSGYIDYIVTLTSHRSVAEMFITQPNLVNLLKDDPSLFIFTPKSKDQFLQSHIPQAVEKMYACARTSMKKVTRAVLSNGWTWIFIVLKFGDGWAYWQSPEMVSETVGATPIKEISLRAVSQICSILKYWVAHSNQDLESDDYFSYPAD